MKRMPVQVYILSGSQALFQTVSIMMMAVGGLAGQMLAPSPELATLPIAAAGLGTLLTIFPASLWMSRAGRRAGFLTGTAAGVVAGMSATAGLYLHSFMLLCAATFLIGIYQAFAQYYRFAAVEVAGSSAGSAAISLVLADGVVAGVAGPWLARAGSALFTVPFMGSFFLLGMVALAGLLLMTGLTFPPGTHRARDKKVRQAWYRIIARPAYLTALFSAATGFGIMVLAMTATPLAMQHHGYTLLQSTTVIQLHVLGMFLPSFITGRLIARYGVLNVMLAGAAFLLLYAVLSVSGQGYSTFNAALIAVGIGWNFLYIGGTTLLSTAISEPEKGFGQAFNDMSVAVCVLLCSLAAGRLLSTAGWERMNLMLIPWIVACAALLVLMKTLTAKRRYSGVTGRAGYSCIYPISKAALCPPGERMSLRYAFNWSIWISAACALYVAGYMLSPLYGSGVMAASFMAMPVYFTMGAPRSGYWHYISSALAGVAWGCLYNTATAVLHTAGLAGLVAATLPVFVITTVICTIHFTFFAKGLISSVPMIFAASAAIAVFGEDKWIPVALSLCGGITLGRISQAGTALLDIEGRWKFRLLSARK